MSNISTVASLTLMFWWNSLKAMVCEFGWERGDVFNGNEHEVEGGLLGTEGSNWSGNGEDQPGWIRLQ